jgi:hypothetical protein
MSARPHFLSNTVLVPVSAHKVALITPLLDSLLPSLLSQQVPSKVTLGFYSSYLHQREKE